jgi:hypothetical protein
MNLASSHHLHALACSLSLASTCLTACAVAPDSEEEVATTRQADQVENGLTMNGLTMNGLTMNGLTMNGLAMNGLTMNGLTMNGLTLNEDATSTLGTDPLSQLFFSYVVSCALPVGQSVIASGLTFNGAVGVAPQWGVDGGSCDTTCQQWVSACVISRVNALGVHVPLSIRGDNPALALMNGEAEAYSDREATYFGNVLTVPQQRYACRAAEDDQTLIGRPCGDGADVSGCIISVLDDDCHVACSVLDSTTGYFGSCATPASGIFVPGVTVYRQ